MVGWVCTGQGGCDDLVVLAVLAFVAVLIAVAVGSWLLWRSIKRARLRRSRPLDDEQHALGGRR